MLIQMIPGRAFPHLDFMRLTIKPMMTSDVSSKMREISMSSRPWPLKCLHSRYKTASARCWSYQRQYCRLYAHSHTPTVRPTVRRPLAASEAVPLCLSSTFFCLPIFISPFFSSLWSFSWPFAKPIMEISVAPCLALLAVFSSLFFEMANQIISFSFSAFFSLKNIQSFYTAQHFLFCAISKV